ncbi:MAG: DegQ family serine endoprotease [Acidobacteria bacterium]|nr:DegQ family serine endoprotease [Acidobacteriota bacterium]
MASDYIRFGRKGAAVGAVLLTGVLLGYSAAPQATVTNPAPVAHEAGSATRALGPATHSYAGIVESVTPAVVTVRSERRVRQVSQPMQDDWLREFFGDRVPAPRRSPRTGGLGSGVIVRADGYVLTNHHVIDGAEQVTVELTDGRSFKADVVGSDAASDLAVLKLENASNLRTLSLGDSNAVAVGDVVLAVGNPLGVGQTVTMGIVSAKGRATGGTTYEDFIQTDAPINQGNSGGALVNTDGELIGINSQILSPSGGNIGIGFSIPANMARNVMTQLIDHGSVRRGMLGVTIQPVTSELATSLGLSGARGALVNGVQPNTPAASAGLRRGDVITRVNGEDIKDYNDVRNRVAQTQPGTELSLDVVRGGKTQAFTVKVGELKPTGDEAPADERGGATSDTTGFGMGVQPLTPAQARELGIDANRGVLVATVDGDGRAASAGLREGDVIEEVDGAPVSNVESLRTALTKGDRPALLLVHRGENTMYLALPRK